MKKDKNGKKKLNNHVNHFSWRDLGHTFFSVTIRSMFKRLTFHNYIIPISHNSLQAKQSRAFDLFDKISFSQNMFYIPRRKSNAITFGQQHKIFNSTLRFCVSSLGYYKIPKLILSTLICCQSIIKAEPAFTLMSYLIQSPNRSRTYHFPIMIVFRNSIRYFLLT